MVQRIFGLLAFVVSTLLANVAYPFCQTTTCDTCGMNPFTGCPSAGVPVAWKRSCVSFSVQSDGSKFAPYPEAEDLVRQALAAWQDVTCGPDGAHPSILVSDAFGPV